MSSYPIRPFNDYAKEFDPQMPQEQYDAMRKHYFDTFVAPRVGKGKDVEATRKSFYSQTERPKTASPLIENVKNLASGYQKEVASAVKTVSPRPLRPITSAIFGDPDEIKQTMARRDTSIHREGGTAWGGLVGEGAGMTALMEGLESANLLEASRISAGFLQKTGIDFLSSSRGLELSSHMLHGAYSFSAYNALEASQPHRNVAAAKGFGEGLLFGAGGDFVGRILTKALSKGLKLTREQAVDAVQKVMAGEALSPELENTITSSLRDSSSHAAREPRPMTVVVDERAGNPKFVVRDAKGQQDSFNLTEDNFEKVRGKLEGVIGSGGSLEHIIHSSEDQPLVNRFLSMLNEKHAGKYETAIPISVEKGSEVASVEALQKQGVDAQVAGKGKVVAIPHAESRPTLAEATRVLDSKAELSPSKRDSLKRDFESAWNSNLHASTRMAAVQRLQDEGFNELLPHPRELAKLGERRVTSDSSFPEQKFATWMEEHKNEDGDALTFHQKGYIQSQLRTLWDRSIPDASNFKQKAMEALRAYNVPTEFYPHGVGINNVVGPGLRGVEEQLRQKQTEEAAWNALSPEEQLQRQIADVEGRMGKMLNTASEDARLGAELKGYKQALAELAEKSAREDSADAEDEIQQVMREEIEQKSRGIDVTRKSDLEEAARLGKFDKPLSSLVGGGEALPAQVPEGERRMVIDRRPHSTGVVINQAFLNEIHPGSRGFATTPATAKAMLRLPEDFDLGNNPVYVIGKGKERLIASSRDTVWHEQLHAHVMNLADFSKRAVFLAAARGPAFESGAQIAHALGKEFSIYKPMDEFELMEEAFVHAATAVRFGDVEYLSKLAKWDTSVEEIYKFVDRTADDLRLRALSNMDPGPSRNLATDRLNFISRMTNSDKAAAMKDMVEMAYGGGDVYFGPEGDAYVLQSGKINMRFASEADLIDHLEKGVRGVMFSPDFTSAAEYAGVKVPIAPKGLGPTRNLPMPEASPEGGWKFAGTQTIRSLYEPTSKWFADLHMKLNEALSASGKSIPLFDRFKAVDLAFREGETWLDANRESASKFLQGGADKLKSYFEVIKTNPRYWDLMQKKLNLTADDMKNIQQANVWLEKFRDDTQIPVFNYLRDDLDKLRRFDYRVGDVFRTNPDRQSSMAFFHRALVNGELDPKDNHLGRFVDFLLRSGMEKKYTGEPLKELQKLVDAKDEAGHYILGTMRMPVGNYVNYMKGIPDATGQVIRKAISQFQTSLTSVFKRVNKTLPAGMKKLPEEFNYPGSTLNKLMMFSYAANIGGRAAIPLRDALQVLSTAMPVIGPSKFLKGVNSLAHGGFDFAYENGALLNKVNVGELYGDMFGELGPHSGGISDKAIKVSNALMAPSRWGHNLARAIVFNSVYEDAGKLIESFRAGRVDWKQVLKETGLWFADKPRQDQLLQLALDKTQPIEAFQKQAAGEVVDLTLWAYRRGAQPLALRTGVGRIFGQYGLWPLNYLSYMKRLVGKISEHPKEALGTLTMWGAVNYAAVETFQAAVGADVSKWFWFSPMGYGGSAHFQAAQDVFRFPEETNEGREARRRLIEYPGQFIPSFTELKAVLNSIGDDADFFDGNGHPTPDFLKVLGFKPLMDEPDRSLEEQIKFEMGEGGKQR